MILLRESQSCNPTFAAFLLFLLLYTIEETSSNSIRNKVDLNDYCLRCLPNKCNETTGVCLECKPGYRGKRCETACPVGTYGKDCLHQCPKTCLKGSVCNFTTGNCLQGCDAGFSGEKCNAPCKYGFFGRNCQNICSLSCTNSSCDPISGQCLACKYGRFGKWCRNISLSEGRLRLKSGAVSHTPAVIISSLLGMLALGIGVWGFVAGVTFLKQKLVMAAMRQSGQTAPMWVTRESIFRGKFANLHGREERDALKRQKYQERLSFLQRKPNSNNQVKAQTKHDVAPNNKVHRETLLDEQMVLGDIKKARTEMGLENDQRKRKRRKNITSTSSSGGRISTTNTSSSTTVKAQPKHKVAPNNKVHRATLLDEQMVLEEIKKVRTEMGLENDQQKKKRRNNITSTSSSGGRISTTNTSFTTDTTGTKTTRQSDPTTQYTSSLTGTTETSTFWTEVETETETAINYDDSSSSSDTTNLQERGVADIGYSLDGEDKSANSAAESSDSETTTTFAFGSTTGDVSDTTITNTETPNTMEQTSNAQWGCPGTSSFGYSQNKSYFGTPMGETRTETRTETATTSGKTPFTDDSDGDFGSSDVMSPTTVTTSSVTSDQSDTKDTGPSGNVKTTEADLTDWTNMLDYNAINEETSTSYLLQADAAFTSSTDITPTRSSTASTRREYQEGNLRPHQYLLARLRAWQNREMEKNVNHNDQSNDSGGSTEV